MVALLLRIKLHKKPTFKFNYIMKPKLIVLLTIYIFFGVKAMAQMPTIAFEADITNQQSNPLSPFKFDAVKYNQGSAFSPRANMFVAPVNGVYFFCAIFLWEEMRGFIGQQEGRGAIVEGCGVGEAVELHWRLRGR